jgi:hypothetical protein
MLIYAIQAVHTADPKRKASTSTLLSQLNEVFSPGLPEHLFLGLFLQCRVCHYTMTKRVFHYHTCPGEVKLLSDGAVVGLTVDDSDSE